MKVGDNLAIGTRDDWDYFADDCEEEYDFHEPAIDCDCDQCTENYYESTCMMGPDGQCGAAGSEHCDFECPMMRK